MKKSLITLFFGVVAVAALAVTAEAQMCGEQGGGRTGGMGRPGMGMMHGMGGMQGGGMMMDGDHGMWDHLMKLGLDDKQKDALKALHSRTMKEIVRKKAEKQVADIELRDFLDKDPVDLKAVEAAAKKSQSFETEIFLIHVKAHEEMKALLTADQRKRLKEMGEGCSAGCGMMGGHEEHKDMPPGEHMHH